MPHPTTLMKLTTRCGSAAIDGLNEALLAKAAEAKLLGTNRIRADTTVARANVSYPTDLGLLAKAMRRDARGGLGRTQQRRLRCTALRRQTHRHAQASNRLGGRRTGGHAQPTTKFSQITPRKRNTPWISELYPLRSTPHACTPARVQDR